MARTLRMLARGGRLTICSRNSASTTWLTKEISVQHGSTIHWRGKSNAASAASDIPNTQKSRKNVSKDERRAMLESFVNKYREANAGKFPTASKAKDGVGGNYYIVKRMLQEIEYNSKLDPSISEAKQPTRNEPKKIRRSIADVEEIPIRAGVDARNEDVAESISFGDGMSSENLRDRATTAHEFIRPAAEDVAEDAGKEARDDQPKFVPERSHVKEEIKENDEVVDKSNRDYTVEVDRRRAELPKNPSTESDGDAEHPQKSSLWRNIKSFANGIISIWRSR